MKSLIDEASVSNSWNLIFIRSLVFHRNPSTWFMFLDYRANHIQETFWDPPWHDLDLKFVWGATISSGFTTIQPSSQTSGSVSDLGQLLAGSLVGWPPKTLFGFYNCIVVKSRCFLPSFCFFKVIMHVLLLVHNCGIILFRKPCLWLWNTWSTVSRSSTTYTKLVL